MLYLWDEPGPTPSTELRFPYTIVMMVIIWLTLGLSYLIARWRQRAKATYNVPRVFVLCSPRTVQYHYELILRVGLASFEFNPDKHDIDISILGQQKNEVVPMTRLNTKTLVDEPLITALSIIVYRLVELPPLGSLVLRHSGPYKAWLYVYDFTVIDLSTNKEHYYTINQYIGSLNKTLSLDDTDVNNNNVYYPIDDVPLPQWSIENIFLVIYFTTNCIILSITLMPINCGFQNDMLSILLSSANGATVVLFLDWLLYYNLSWNADRREYFNHPDSRFLPGENTIKIILLIVATLIGGCAVLYALKIDEIKNSLVWFLATLNTCTLVIGFWNAARQADFGETIVGLGLKIRGIQTVPIGAKHNELVSDQTKSASASDDGGSTLSAASKLARSFGPRSSVKSFGFEAVKGHPSRGVLQKLMGSQLSVSAALTRPSHITPTPHKYQHQPLVAQSSERISEASKQASKSGEKITLSRNLTKTIAHASTSKSRSHSGSDKDKKLGSGHQKSSINT